MKHLANIIVSIGFSFVSFLDLINRIDFKTLSNAYFFIFFVFILGQLSDILKVLRLLIRKALSYILVLDDQKPEEVK